MSTHQQPLLAEDTILLELATMIARRASVGEVFAAFAGRIAAVTAFDFASILVYDPPADEFHTAGVYPEGALPVDAPRTFARGEVNVDLLATVPGGIEYFPAGATTAAAAALARYGIGAAWTVPLADGPEIVGIMTVARVGVRSFDAASIHFLRRAAELLAGAVRDEVRVRSVRDDAARSRLLTELALSLNSGEPVNATYEQVHATLREAVPTTVALLARAGAQKRLELIGASGIADPNLLLEHLGDAQCPNPALFPAARPTVLIAHEDIPAECAPLLPVDCIALSSLRRGEEQLGVLLLGRQGHGFTPQERDYLDVVATLLGQALAVQKEREGTRRELQEQRAIAHIVAAAAREADPGALTASFAGHLGNLAPDPFVAFEFGRADSHITLHLPGEGTVCIPAPGPADAVDMDQWIVQAATPGGSRSFIVSAARIGGSMLGYLVVGTSADARQLPRSLLGLCALLAQIIGPILQQSRMAQEADRERALLRIVTEALSEGVLLVDQDNQVVYSNPMGEQVRAFVDATLDGSGGDGSTEDARELLRNALATGEPQRGRAEATVRGATAWLDYRFVPLESEGHRLLCVVRDVTEQVEIEARREQHREEMERAARLAALGALVGGVAHELNNPLTAILGFSELLIDTIPEGPAQEDLGVINREAQRARNIVQDLLFIARAAPLERRPFTMDTVVGHIARIRQSTWVRDGIAVDIDLGEVSSPILGNDDRITQVLLNLVTNAEDAVRGRADAAISVCYREDGTRAVLEVGDNGVGMDGPTRERVFEPFFTTKQGTGTGLGLSVSYSIVLAHDGELTVESAPGRGSRFRVTLPLAASAATTGSQQEPGGPAEARRLRVLVIDDEPNLRRVCQRMIQSMGHECSVADGPEAATQLAGADSFDVVLCDYRLAANSADAVLERFSQVRPELVARTVIATGAASDAGVQALVRRHGLRLLPKPYGADELEELLAKVAAA